MSQLCSKPIVYYSLAIALRVGLLVYGIWQDSNTPLKYTDIDYYVFTDAARFVAQGQSPYQRDTYRYTPLLAWILWPTTLAPFMFSFGKILFASGDLVAGWLIVRILKNSGKFSDQKAFTYASIWLLNPMVATISTRGSSEGLLGALVITLLWAVLQRRLILAGVLLGLSVHFKIYPFIYASSIIWWLDDQNVATTTTNPVGSLLERKTKTDSNKIKEICSCKSWCSLVWNFFNPSRLVLTAVSLSVFAFFNILMYSIYGHPFLQNTYLYHVTRLDHRHNFSPYNILLYLLSSSSSSGGSYVYLVQMAFLPQLFLSAIAIPLLLAKKDLPSTMLAQTFAFVSFNKVCTSQYYIWYIVFLPFYIPKSFFLTRKFLGVSVAIFWITAQAIWLHQAFQLEFLGRSTFIPGLWLSSILFFIINALTLGLIVKDIGFEGRGVLIGLDKTDLTPAPN